MIQGGEDWDPTVSYREFLKGVVDVFRINLLGGPPNPLSLESYLTLVWNNSIGTKALSYLIALALALTLLRSLLKACLFRPIGRHYDLTPVSQEKFSESCWKFCVYSFTWTWAFYLAVIKYRFFQKPTTLFVEYKERSADYADIEMLYAVETGFYLHSLLAIFFLDPWNKDSGLMCFHHLLTIALMGFSHIIKCTGQGLLILLYHDCNDVVLEFSRIFYTLKVQGGQLKSSLELLSNILFMLFSFVWFVSRLYFYPLRLIHHASTVVLDGLVQKEHFTYACYLMCLFLFVINIHWTTMIIELVVKILKGKNTVRTHTTEKAPSHQTVNGKKSI